jgi:hypothetical protein
MHLPLVHTSRRPTGAEELRRFNIQGFAAIPSAAKTCYFSTRGHADSKANKISRFTAQAIDFKAI